MKKNTLTFLFLLIQIFTFGQEKLLKDLDNDGIEDIIHMDSIKSTIVCKLSTQKFRAISSKSIEILNTMSGLVLTKNGFEFLTIGCGRVTKINSATIPKPRTSSLSG